MSTKSEPRTVWCFSINGLRELRGVYSTSTYSKFPIPDVRTMVKLIGDYSWAQGLKINVGKNPWETFKQNPILWQLVKSPTSCYVDISHDEETGQTIFYRDQQDCIVWYVDPQTGKVYSYTDGDTPIADDVEEFWLRQYIEATLWYYLVFYRKKLKDAPELLKKYARFYQRRDYDAYKKRQNPIVRTLTCLFSSQNKLPPELWNMILKYVSLPNLQLLLMQFIKN